MTAKTLKAMLAAHNDAALEALASKGALRRALRDLDKGKASVDKQDDASADVTADGQSVHLPLAGPVGASCSCPAKGVCRHIILAVLVLRTDDEVDAPGETEEPAATDFLCGLDANAIARFAGADFAKAGALAAEPGPVEIRIDGPNVTVAIEDLGASVTFISDQGLRKAVYKGRKTRQRVTVTAAAMLIRSERGIAPEASAIEQAPAVSAEFLEQTQRALERAVSAVLPGRSPVAEDIFLDLAISSRVETLPRLSSELKTLAVQARHAVSRAIGFQPEQFLKDAARCYALLEALRREPDNVLYTGVLRRDFAERDGVEIWLLGAARWRYSSGARGVSVYGWSPSDAGWYSASDGRARGIDPGFDPANVYRGPLWGAGTMQGLIGSGVALAAARVSEDRAIALSLSESATAAEARASALSPDDIRGTAHSDWRDLQSDLSARFGHGLSRTLRPQPALIAPEKFGALGFNDIEQSYEWEAHDGKGARLILSIDGNDHRTALELRNSAGRITAMLIEATIGASGPRYRPVTVFTSARSKLEIRNLDFDPWPYQRKSAMRNLVDKINSMLGKEEKIPDRADPLGATVSKAVDELVALASQSSTESGEAVRKRCEASGLITLADALARAVSDSTLEAALVGAYIASEVEAALWLDA